MARTTLQQKRTVTDEVQAVACDLCSTVFSRADQNERGLVYTLKMPDGYGRFHIYTIGAEGHQHQEPKHQMDLCPPCAAVAWDMLQERKK